MADSIGSLCDKIATVNEKLFRAQSDLYQVRKMSFEEFKETFGTSDEKLNVLYEYFKKATDLNLQRQANILELDVKLVKLIKDIVNGEDIDNGSVIQNQHKTY